MRELTASACGGARSSRRCTASARVNARASWCRMSCAARSVHGRACLATM
ncbi:hypothetical protein BURPS406E_J0256 [Burkholderia pseudomallei 406e]|nr:hypothetical protein BURPS406E_J0256 [Burkholderia pseudomallei 406e]EDS88165.1 hypothetical protein BURPSS13_C0121 [Burkholderia pseudomallei S13]EDU09922.1 hypothetical protein BURPS1655_L0053 [Burkholderia pseudomallei 1655]